MKLRYFIIIVFALILVIGLVFVFSGKLFFKNGLNLSFVLSKLNPVVEGAFSQNEGLVRPNFASQNLGGAENTDKIEPEKTPEQIKAVYLTSWSAGSIKKINYLIALAKTTEINAVVIDVKDYSGYVAYKSQVPEVILYGAGQKRIPDIDVLIKRLHQEGIYTIARIAVFQDPVLARAKPELAIYNKYGLSSFWSFLSVISFWLDNLKLAWVDPASKEVWDYNINIAKEALSHGFDEINFDYVRFPSDGNLKAMGFPVWEGKTARHEVIKDFFKEIREQMPDAKLSVDIFGLTTTNYDDLGVGQIIEDAFQYFDYVSPMVYPSHYASGFLGYKNPAKYPYEVIKYSLEKAQIRLDRFKQINETEDKKINAKLRPWLQDFNMGALYNSSMVRAEINAVYDGLGDNFNGFMLWNPSNYYQIGALEKE